VSAPEHSVPERARAYLITDAQVAAHAARYPATRGAGRPEGAPAAARWPQAARDAPGGADGPGAVLWAALADAGPGGATIAELLAVTGMTRATLYRRLGDLARSGRASRAALGAWRAGGPLPLPGPGGDGQ
jgi:hypothetical protein